MWTPAFGSVAAVTWLVVMGLPAVLAAQPPSADGRRWEVEIYAGAVRPNRPAGGTTALPLPGPPLTTSSPLFPTRQVPSWLLGDGAALLNDVNAEFGLAERVVPLDSAFAASGLSAGTGATLGVRVRRTLTRRLSIEAAIEAQPGAIAVAAALESAAESTRESFERAIRALLSSGPFSDVVVMTTRTTESSRTALAASGAVHFDLRSFGSFEPYVTAGAGLLSGTGEGAAVTIESVYRFMILETVPIEETDRVTVRAVRGSAVAAIAGGGVRRRISDRWTLRIDGRVSLGPSPDRLLLDAAPTVAVGAPTGFIESFTHPSIQFSNHPSTGRQSTISGAPIEGFRVFQSEGLATRLVVTIGLARRF
jgi:hypothetical protein